jgi:NADH-quinone oxidoreductase subunit J
MTITQVLFILIALATLAGAVLVVTVRNLFHAAILLIVSFFGVTGVYVLLDAGFFAAAQFLVYIGAISILIIFAVMLTRGVITSQRANAQWAPAAVVSAIVFVVLAVMLGPVSVTISGRAFGDMQWVKTPGEALPAVPQTYVAELGRSFVDLNQYAVPFLLMGSLILIAMIGAIWVARDRSAADAMRERAETAAEETADAQPVQEPLPLNADAAQEH